MTTVLLVLIVLLLSAGLVMLAKIARQQKHSIAELRAQEEAIVAEERRMFHYLHDLGEAIWRDDQQASMYRLIVEGAIRVTQSTGGALYLIDEATQHLVPRHYSDFCAPLIIVPERVQQQMKDNSATLLSTLRMQAVTLDQGLLGSIYTQQKTELVPDLGTDARLGANLVPTQQNVIAMIGPLSFGTRRLGVLAVTSPKEGRNYNANDFEVFNSLIEQSAFALANAMSHQEAAKNRMDQQELLNASQIQQVLLPDRDPEVPGFIVAGKNIPARTLSGDYFDFLKLPGGKFGAVIADVSGKGLGAAMITVMCRTLMRAKAAAAASPSAVLAAVNRQIAPDIREDMFITMSYVVVDKDGSKLTIARAGHNAALLWRKATGKVEAIHPPGLGVGIDKGAVFERVTKDESFEMQPGDCLLLYTDGVNEAMDPKGIEFGEERVQEQLAKHAPHGPKAVIGGIIADLEHFLKGRRSHDDITLIAMQKTA
ncbi:GAF domain-containing SpoIIE family protein phosphatase [Prosthecobacter sp.]|uniref:PP2C family protein-serine/threonine phosphatase n=1 Tax=Prosthecobacter sp. TaxID=1965333 RepID=UPI002AB83F12|nr:GAF domain-containing SpoIIE family protein phosphatase [Prosthecobacter sp.]MDZ4401345.1 GAF domain-containing SpoIIE family protein phosphatase [Prosthecobacter sp.]